MTEAMPFLQKAILLSYDPLPFPRVKNDALLVLFLHHIVHLRVHLILVPVA